VIDTLVLARRKHPGGHNTLDDLCSRYGINSLRNKHGALLDVELLAAVYVELTTTRQEALQVDVCWRRGLLLSKRAASVRLPFARLIAVWRAALPGIRAKTSEIWHNSRTYSS
jgi:DNA polymerase III epsilon subunit-like protein